MSTTSNISQACSVEGPSSAELFYHMETEVMFVVATGGCFSVMTLLFYIFDIIHVLRWQIPSEQLDRIMWLLGIYPVYSIFAFINLCIPRAASIIDFGNTLYFAVCCLKFLHLTQYYFGGRDKMLDHLQTNGVLIPLQSPPYCCCCFCCPSIYFTKANVTKIYLLILQFVIIPPLVTFIIMLVAVDSTALAVTGQLAETIFVIVRTISISGAFYGLILIFRVSKDTLSKHFIAQKFALMKLAIVFGHVHVQILIFNILGVFNVISCDRRWSSASRAAWINSACLPFEMLFLCFIARKIYRRERLTMQHQLLTEEPFGSLSFEALSKSGTYGT